MSGHQLLFRADSKRPLLPGERIGEGGEGIVYELDDEPGMLVKVYKRRLAGEQPRKLRALAATGSPELSTVAAWPQTLVVNGFGELCGFTMPYVTDGQRLTTLISPVTRLKRWATRDYRFLVRVAANLARLVATVHAAGVVIGDLSEANILVTPDGLTYLVDCDSVQVIDGDEVLECRVGVARYLAPEIQTLELARTPRGPQQDIFSLAVLLFQLLMMGRHPFAGVHRGDADLDEATCILRGLYAYSPRVRSLEPPVGAPPLGLVGETLAGLFERAFLPSLPPALRPEPEEWIAALDTLEADLVRCPPRPGHYYPRHLQSCVWCGLRE
ncbi:MAG TPA: hypothetical protein VEI97_02260, partial [bacterium]|nr:hypothetical protein [bacterium]